MRSQYSFTGLLAKIAGAIAFTAVWFWLSLKGLDYWDSHRQAEPPPQSGGGASVSPLVATQKSLASIIYAINTSTNLNWEPASAKVQSKIIRDGISISSNTARFDYQLQTSAFTTTKDVSYVVDFDITVTDGSAVLGVLDSVANRWITQKPITSRTDTLTFKAASDKTRIIIFNNSTGSLAVVISRIFVSRA